MLKFLYWAWLKANIVDLIAVLMLAAAAISMLTGLLFWDPVSGFLALSFFLCLISLLLTCRMMYVLWQDYKFDERA